MATPDARFLPSNLKFRLSSVVIVLVLGATVLVTLVALLLAERDMKGVIGDQQYSMLSSAAAFLDDRIETRKRLMATLAESIPAAAYANPAALQTFLEQQHIMRSEFGDIAAFDPRGQLVATLVARPRGQPLSAAGYPYFETTVASRRGLLSAPFMGRLSGAPVVLVTQPVFDASGHLMLVLAGAINLQRANFLRQIDSLKPGKTGFIFIMTFGGILVDHPDRARLLHHINERPGLNPATDQALAGFEGWTEASNKDGSAGIYTYKRLKSTDWIVAARYPTAEAFAPMIRMRYRSVIAAALCALLAGGFAWLLIYRLLAPLEILRRNVSAIRKKRAGIGALRVQRDDEIGELGTAFYELMAEREAALERIRDSEKRARIIADNMPALIAYVDSETRYQFTNAHYQDMMGLDPKSMIGRTIEQVMGKRVYSQLEDKVAGALRGERMHFEFAGEGPDRAVHYMIDYIPDFAEQGGVQGFYILVLDISARKSAELTQAASEKRLKLITDNLPVLISYLDREHKFRFANATFQKWFGVAPSELVGKSMGATLEGESDRHVRVHLERALGGEVVTFELKLAVGNRQCILETTFIPDVQADGGVAGAYALTHDMTRMKEAEEKLKLLARQDTLTGIANRRMFGEALQLALKRARRQQSLMALAYLDIDHFKNINDTYGHAVGDEVLKEFARRLQACVRLTDTVARLSGDEFVILLEDIGNDQEAAKIAAKIIDAIRIPFALPGAGAPLAVSSSVGIALFGGGSGNHEDLLANADSALYAAKRNGRDRYAVHGMV